MLLKELAALLTLSRLVGDGETAIMDVHMDSRRIGPGHLFICIPGFTVDGHDFAPQAVQAGAAALVTERQLDVPVPQLVVPNARYAMAVIAAHMFGYPSEEMQVIGITGTKGKTTTSYLLERVLSDCGHRTGLMGNIHVKIGDTFHANKATNTQESVNLQRYLRAMADAGAEYCVMEATSVALELGRVLGTRFRTAVFTNFTHDHLDFHKTTERYREAKGLLFARLGNTFAAQPEKRQFAVLNADDAASPEFARLTGAQVITYGIDSECNVRATNIRMTNAGTEFTVVTSFAGEAQFVTQLVGKFNVYNTLAAIAACLAESIPLQRIQGSLAAFPTVEGRMERVAAGQPYLVLVDYAHTPDSLEKALATIKEFAQGSVITVFGCGGDRDKTKRPVMGRIAATYSDYVYVTSDNPRSEQPDAIIGDIVPGIAAAGIGADCYETIADRRAAIQKAIDRAGPRDVVLIAGKGHETYQEIHGVKHDFDDRRVAEAAIRSRG